MTAAVCEISSGGKAGFAALPPPGQARPPVARPARTANRTAGPGSRGAARHLAARLLGGSGRVEGDEAAKDVLVRETGGPAIGVGHRAIEPVVQFLEDEHEPIVEDAPRAGVEPVGLRARAEPFET